MLALSGGQHGPALGTTPPTNQGDRYRRRDDSLQSWSASPHSMEVGLTAIDDGQVYDSTVR
jgi:hypothetical protein